MSSLRKDRHNLLVSDLIQASLQIAKESGWAKLDVRTLAKKLKFSTIIVYRHFGNKQGLITAIQAHGFANLKEKFIEGSLSKANNGDQIYNVSMKFYEFAETDKHLYQIMFSLAGVETMQPPNEAIMEAGGVVKEIIKKYTSKDRIDIEFLKWWAICQGFISINLNPEIKPDQAIMKKAFKQTVQIFIAQL